MLRLYIKIVIVMMLCYYYCIQ